MVFVLLHQRHLPDFALNKYSRMVVNNTDPLMLGHVKVEAFAAPARRYWPGTILCAHSEFSIQVLFSSSTWCELYGRDKKGILIEYEVNNCGQAK
jgi:hypothetical protein